MKALLGARERLVAVVGLGIIASMLFVAKGLPAWNEWRRDVRAVAAQRVQRATQVRTTIGGFAERLDSLELRTKRLLSRRGAFVHCDSLAAAPGALRAAVSAIAAAAMIRVDSVEARLSPARDGVLPRVEVEMQGVGDIEGLATLLRRVETGEPMLAVRRLRVRPHSIASPADRPEMLELTVVVEGIVLVPRGVTP